MTDSNFICPHCMYEASISAFDRVGKNLVKCRRCRSEVDDPNAFSPDINYVDCNSHSLVYLFPFQVEGKKTVVFVRNGYLALIISTDRKIIWLAKKINHVPEDISILRIYYICLSPLIIWGTKGTKEFGSYGTAQISLTEKYVRDYCKTEDQIKTLEKDLRDKISHFMAGYIENEVARNNTLLLEHKAGYNNALGPVSAGITIKEIDVIGYRHANGQTHLVVQRSIPVVGSDDIQKKKNPVSIIKLPLTQYTVRKNDEDVFFWKNLKCKRHKAGEEIRPEKLRGVCKGYQFHSKEFDFTNGWGIYNIGCADGRFFSAHGTISFYIDSTEKLGALLYKTKDWNTFEEQFFINILKKEISSALKDILDNILEQTQLNSKKISELLNTISFELANRLNAEDSQTRDPPFRAYGLRVKQVDILNINLYSDRR